MNINIPTAQEIIDQLRPRQDSYAIWRNSHPIPARDQNKNDLGLSLNAINDHLYGRELIGIYSTSKDDTCTWAAIDIDNYDTATKDARAIIKTFQKYEFDAKLERSKSGKGYHVWVLLDSEIRAYKLRLFLLDIVRKSGINTQGKLKAEKAFDRVYPNQDSINGGYGNLLALPFWGQAVTNGNSLFIDTETLEPYQDQLAVLQQAQRTTEAQIDQYIRDHKLGNATALAASRNKIGKHSFQPSSQGDIQDLQYCEYLKYCDAHRNDLPEPLWFALATNLAVFGEQGRSIFLALSEGYDHYNEKESNAKFDGALKAAEQGKHPTSCKRLEQEGFACPLLKQCPAKFVANYPSVYADLPMSLTELQQQTHTITGETEQSSTFRRFALGWQQLDEQGQEEILSQIVDAAGLGEKERKELMKKLKLVKPSAGKESNYLPLVRDEYSNAPGPEGLVLPRGYSIKRNKLYATFINRKGEPEEELVADQVIIVTETGHDHDRAEAATRTIAFRTPLGDWEQVQVSRADSSDGKYLHKALANVSFIMSSDQGPAIAKYLKNFEIVNGHLLQPKLTIARLGWVKIRDSWEYIPYSNAAILIPKGSGDRVLARPETFAGTGEVSEWLKIFTLLHSAPAATFTIIAALTPALFPAFGAEAQSHSVTIAGKSGTGKSAIQKVSATIYGLETALLHSWDATSVGLEQALALRTHMPAMYEDLQNATDKQVSGLIYRIFNGLGRERGAKEGGTRRTAEFQTVMIASAEADIREKAQFAGFLRRGLVITASVFGELPISGISSCVAKLDKIAKNNRGSLGRDWVNRIRTELLESDDSERLSERIIYWTKVLQEQASQIVDVTLARLMAQHMTTAELVEQWYGVPDVTSRLLTVWSGITQDTQALDIYRKYMLQTLEWAVSEGNLNGTFGAIGTKKREGVFREDYVAVLESALKQFLERTNNTDVSISIVLAEWAERGWIQKDGVKNTVKVKADDKRVRMVKILLDAKDLPEMIEHRPAIIVEGDRAIVERIPEE